MLHTSKTNTRLSQNRSFIILGDAGLPWVYPLALELGKFGSTVAINLVASLPLFNNPSRWSYDDPDHLTQRETWAYPPGFNGKLSLFFRKVVKARLNKKIRSLYSQTKNNPYVITLYPWFLHYVLNVQTVNLIYLNYDDYSISINQQSVNKNKNEEELVKRAGTILCSSAYQTERFLERFANRKKDIFYLPHGVHDAFINPAPEKIEPNNVCIVGSLTSRYDWKLIHEVVTKIPEAFFIFVGNISMDGFTGQDDEWKKFMQVVLELPNVKHIGGIKHSQTPPFYWKSAVNWMPYKADLPFVKASCPLKIPDGIASGRRITSPDVPECRLYPDWINIYQNAVEAVSLIKKFLANSTSVKEMERSRLQIEFARSNRWFNRASHLVDILDRKF